MENRLSKILAQAGVASRRASEKLIAEGKVEVNGQVVFEPQTRVQLGKDRIVVNGTALKKAESKVYYVLNKPKGFVCTNQPGRNIKRAIDLFGDRVKKRLFTVGRLDKETEGLLIVTNDGHFAHAVIHPSSGIQKEYLAKTGQEITHEHLVALSQGTIVEGVLIRPKKVVKVRKGTVKIVVSEGKKHEVRHLLEAVGLSIKELKRIRIGSLSLQDLPIGGWRELSSVERDHLLSR